MAVGRERRLALLVAGAFFMENLAATDTSSTDLAPYRIAFAVLAVLTLLAVVEAARLPRTAGDAIRPAARPRAQAG